MKFLFVCASLASVLSFPSLLVAAETSPNFLLIIADDLCWRDLGYQGNPDVKTPNLDRLAAQGMRLDGMFSPQGDCT